VKAHHHTGFEQMVTAMRQRLHPTKAYLFADQLRICVGLDCAETDKSRLLKILLQEVSLSLGTQFALQTPMYSQIAARPA
jgi:hypothetical protein